MKRLLWIPLLLAACQSAPPMNPPSVSLEALLPMPAKAVSAKAFVSGNRILDLQGKMLAGGNTGRSRNDIPAVGASLDNPGGIALDPQGRVVFSDTGNHRIYRIEGGKLAALAGTGTNFTPIGDGGPATSAQLNRPTGLAFDSQGLLYFADSDNHRIRRILQDGTIETFAGKGAKGHGGDGGAAKDAALNRPEGLAFDEQGNLYVADTGNHKIRRIRKGTIETFAGNGEAGFRGDGNLARDASLDHPTSVLIQGADVFVADTGNHRIRWIDAYGRIQTVAGDGKIGKAKAGPGRETPLDAPVLGGDGLLGDSSGLYRLRVERKTQKP